MFTTYNYNGEYKPFVTCGQKNIGTLLNGITNMNPKRDSISKVFKKKANSKDMGIPKSIIIVCGGCGFALNEHTINQLKTLDESLDRLDSYVHIVRGANDDPSLFTSGSTPFKRIFPTADYSVVNVGGKNILCIGGAISINKKWKIEHADAKDAPKYYEGESTKYIPETLSEIIKSCGSISIVVSSTPPSFVDASVNDMDNSSWLCNDDDLKLELLHQRKCMDDIYSSLTCERMHIGEWIYDSLTRRNDAIELNGILFRSLPMMDFRDLSSNGFKPMKINFEKKIKDIDARPYIQDRRVAVDDGFFEVGEDERMEEQIEEGDIDENDMLEAVPAHQALANPFNDF